jgi:hypothetical protein
LKKKFVCIYCTEQLNLKNISYWLYFTTKIMSICPIWNFTLNVTQSLHFFENHPYVLLIIMWPHSSILMWPNSSILKYYWFLWYLIPGTDVLLILMWPLSSMLMCYWLSCDLIPAYWCVIDSHVISFQHTDVLLILMLPRSSMLMHY